MKIDYSQWIIVFGPGDGSVCIENPTEGIILSSYFDSYNTAMTGDDPIKHLKELAKQQIRNHYLHKQLSYLAGKQLSVEDNLDYIEDEAKRRGIT